MLTVLIYVRSMKVTIEGREFDLELTPQQLEVINRDALEEVYAYHNTTREAFDKLYKNIPTHIKALAQEELIVKMYNKGETLDWQDDNQRKWFLRLDFSREEITLDLVNFRYCNSDVPPLLSFLREEDAREAWSKYKEVYKISRNHRI
jgi:hypothetical protein